MTKILKTAILTITMIGIMTIGGNLCAQVNPATSTTPNAQQGKHMERHPAIHHAIHALEKAKAELEAANHDFGGHRVAALRECDQAINQLRLALKFDRK